jgi:hypothetical protein
MWRGRRRGTDPYAVILLMQLAQQIAQLERKPPVTLAAIAGARSTCQRVRLATLQVFRNLIHTEQLPNVCMVPCFCLQHASWLTTMSSYRPHSDHHQYSMLVCSLT